MRAKKWKRAAAWLLTGILMIGAVGCGKDAGEDTLEPNVSATNDETGGETAKGRYMETQKETPEGLAAIPAMVRLSDGSIAILNLDTGELHISSDNGDTWESRGIPAFARQISMGADITTNAVAPDGGVFFSYVQWESEEDPWEEESQDDALPSVDEHYVYVDSEGNGGELNMTVGEGVFYLQEAVFDTDTTLLSQEIGGRINRIDLEAKTIESIKIFEDEADMTYCVDDYILTGEEIYQLSTKEFVKDDVLTAFIKEAGYKQIAFYLDKEENTLYCASEKGLYSHVIGGSTMEQLLDGNLSNLGDPTKTAVSLLKNEDDSFLIAYEDGEIDLYTYDKDAPAVPSQQISVYSLRQSTTVSKAISLFRKAHPDVFVKQEIGLAGDYGITEEDAIRNLNTRLLSGEGPDILLLDDMPFDSYIEKNVLADLGEIIDGLESSTKYFSNVLRAYETEGGLYAVPIRFRIPICIGEADLVAGIVDLETFKEAVKKAREKHAQAETILGTYSPEELLERLYMMLSASSFLEEEKLNIETVKELLTQADEIYQEEHKNIIDEILDRHDSALAWSVEHGLAADKGSFIVNAGAIFNILDGTQVLVQGTLSSMSDFQYAEGVLENKEGMAYDLLSGQKEKVFTPNGIAGINAKSNEMELAIAFLQELLGEEVQKSDLEDGFPVNADAYDKFAENPHPEREAVGFAASVAGEDGSTVGDVIQFVANWPKEAAIASLKEKIGSLEEPGLSDEVIRTAILESGAKVLEGTLTVEEGCDEIVRKVELYLAE